VSSCAASEPIGFNDEAAITRASTPSIRKSSSQNVSFTGRMTITRQVPDQAFLVFQIVLCQPVSRSYLSRLVPASFVAPKMYHSCHDTWQFWQVPTRSRPTRCPTVWVNPEQPRQRRSRSPGCYLQDCRPSACIACSERGVGGDEMHTDM
jgi:hypothetical protein